jgi:hypothetical protein
MKILHRRSNTINLLLQMDDYGKAYFSKNAKE